MDDEYDDEIGDRVDDSTNEIVSAVARVESAVREKWSSLQWLVWAIVVYYIFSLIGDVWHSKWRYAVNYGVSEQDVSIDDEPHDCAFLTAPLGNKYCHYERAVFTVRWATSQAGQPIASYDEGKTWTVFDPAGRVVPQYSTVEEVHIGWDKKDD